MPPCAIAPPQPFSQLHEVWESEGRGAGEGVLTAAAELFWCFLGGFSGFFGGI